MIAEILLILAGHSSSLFPSDNSIDPALIPLLHPGERDCLESLCRIAHRYRVIKSITSSLSRESSQYICALCAALNQILKKEYEALVVDTEARILKREAEFVASGSFVPLSAVRATFSEWDAPLVALESLMKELQSASEKWKAGPLIDLLISRSRTGVHKIASILQRLSRSVQRVWRSQLATFMIHGTISPSEPIATADYALIETATPSCISEHTRTSIAYVGRAIGTIRAAKWHIQLPRELASKHSTILESVFPEDRHRFDRAIFAIRTNISEWMWLNVLTQKDAEDAVDSLANYLLLRNGEFGLSLIQEIERLRSSSKALIREQDLHLVLLRASMGTTAQHDPLLSRLRFSLPSGPVRPLLPPTLSQSTSSAEFTTFDDLLLGTPLALNYSVTWPLDLFLHSQDLQVYGALFSYLSALRKTHTRIHACWTSLSNSQRARRRWTGLGDGGTAEDLGSRRELLRCGWGLVRELNWFLDSLLAYTMVDVIDVEWRRLKMLLAGTNPEVQSSASYRSHVGTAESAPGASSSHHLDFTTLRTIHHDYLERIIVGTLLSNQPLTAVIRTLLQLCDKFVVQVERWGGDVLPELLIEGSINNAENEAVGGMVRERLAVVSEINHTLHDLLQSFYEQLTSSTSQPFVANADASKSVLVNMSTANISGFHSFIKRRRGKGDGEVRRHVERLLLRLDFNGEFSRPRKRGFIYEQLATGNVDE